MTLLLLSISALAAIFVLWPAITSPRTRWEYSDEDTPLGRLAVRKEVLVGNLADLDFEFAMGKMNEDDYRSMRDTLKGQTLLIMEQIDVIGGGPRSESPKAAARGDGCSACGAAVPPQARFCPNCGSPLEG